ncbi:MAG: hypothetical protein K6E29_06440 [Cyanobacteria bacterium RUI128]|nr:hypothetical protein [Cyanobacteria bacterium RUI128]
MVTQVVDFTKPRTIKKSYNLNGYDTISIKTPGSTGFLDGISSVTASGNVLTVKAGGKTIKFINFHPDMTIQALGGEDYNKSLTEFYKDKNGAESLTITAPQKGVNVYGTNFDEIINISAEGSYTPTKKNAQKNIGVTITAGGGSDTITATKYKDKIFTGVGNDTLNAGQEVDTITVDGSGTKTIQIKKGDGDDVIVFKGDGLKSKVVLAFDYNQGDDDFAEYDYVKEGNNLLIKRSWTEAGVTTTETTTVKDYFKNEPSIFISVDNSGLEKSLSNIFHLHTFTFDYEDKSKAQTIVGTAYDDDIKGGKKADKIVTGDGIDKIYGNKGNDKITINGIGDKTINIGKDDGNDIITFDLDKIEVDEKIKVQINLDTEYEPKETTYKVASNKKDLVITNKYDAIAGSKAVTQKITVKNYFGNTNKIDLTVGDTDVYAYLSAGKGKPTTKGSTITGTIYDDEISGTVKADTIKALAGNDTINGSRGNDKIYGGDGDDVYVYNQFDEKGNDIEHYKDTIYNSNGSDTIRFTNLKNDYLYFTPSMKLTYSDVFPTFVNPVFDTTSSNPTGATYVKSGNDLVIGAYQAGDDYTRTTIPVNKVVLKDYFKSAKGEYGVKYIDNGKTGADYMVLNLADNMQIEHSWRTTSLLSDHKANKYTGTAYNDYIEGANKQDTLKGGDGNDVLNGWTATSGKDYLYGGDGNDTMIDDNAYMYGGTGNDIYVSTPVASSVKAKNIISDESGYDTLSLALGSYMTYFDLTQKDGNVVSTGDMYVKDTTFSREKWIQYQYRNTQTEETFWDFDPDLASENIVAVTEDKVSYGLTETTRVTRKISTAEVGLDDVKYIAENVTTYGYVYKADANHILWDTDADLASKREDIVQYIKTVEGVDEWQYKQDGRKFTVLEANDKKVTEYTVYYGYKDSSNNVFYSTDSNLRGDGINQYLINNEWQTQTIGTRIVNAADYPSSKTTSLVKSLTFYGYIDNEKVFYSDKSDLQYKKYIVDGKAQTQTVEMHAWDNEQEAQGLISLLKNDNYGNVIKDGTTEVTAVDTYVIGYNEPFFAEKGSAASYDQDKIDDTAAKIATWLNAEGNGFASVQDAIKNGTKEQLKEMLKIFKTNMFTWSDVNYVQLYEEQLSYEGSGTTYIEDDSWAGSKNDNVYTLHITSSNRYSIINDYAGDDKLYLDSSANGYSFLFDVEVDAKGNLMNYSRDFYIKYAGKEAEETGVVVNCGREKMHAIEEVYAGGNKIFTYSQNTIDSVRQNVAGWLVDNGYGSVQDVLHSDNETDITSLVAQFAPINQ